MIICNVSNEVNGRKSELHAKLLEIFKDQKQADLYYSKVLGDDFMKEFGNWKKNYEAIGDSNPVLETTGEIYDTGEPKLFYKKSRNQWYFRLKDR